MLRALAVLSALAARPYSNWHYFSLGISTAVRVGRAPLLPARSSPEKARIPQPVATRVIYEPLAKRGFNRQVGCPLAQGTSHPMRTTNKSSNLPI